MTGKPQKQTESGDHYSKMVIPRNGDWVVLSGQGHYSACEFAAGQVHRVANWSVRFRNAPLGKSEHRLNQIFGIFPNEAGARAAAHKLREAQEQFQQDKALATHKFWRAAHDAGVTKGYAIDAANETAPVRDGAQPIMAINGACDAEL